MGEPNNAYIKNTGEKTSWKTTIWKTEEELGG
jgi:hypothetical protein